MVKRDATETRTKDVEDQGNQEYGWSAGFASNFPRHLLQLSYCAFFARRVFAPWDISCNTPVNTISTWFRWRTPNWSTTGASLFRLCQRFLSLIVSRAEEGMGNCVFDWLKKKEILQLIWFHMHIHFALKKRTKESLGVDGEPSWIWIYDNANVYSW